MSHQLVLVTERIKPFQGKGPTEKKNLHPVEERKRGITELSK